MAQENSTSNNNALPTTNSNDDDNSNAPPAATNSDSMNPGKDSNGDGPKTVSLVGAGASNKGKGVAKTKQEEEEGGSSKGKSTAVEVAANDATGRGRCRRGDRDVHIITERERRKRMSEMFANLNALLPSLPDKTDKANIVLEAIHYIKSLEASVSKLEKRKMEMELARGRCCAAGGGVSSSAAPPPASVAPTLAVSTVVEHGGIWPAAVPLPHAGTVTAALGPAGLQTWSGPNVVLSVSGDDAYINVCVARRPGVLTMVAAVLQKYNIDVVTSGIASDSSKTMFTIHARVNGANNQFRDDNVASEEIYKLAVSEIMVWLSS